MLLAPKYRGTELPIYDPEEYRLRSPRSTPDLNAPTFVRAVRVLAGRRLRSQGIQDLLGRTDQELDSLASRCGASVIGHKWGLYPLSGASDRLRYQIYTPYNPEELRLPAGHIVVAEVDYIKHPAHFAEHSLPGQLILQGISSYEHALNFHRLIDMGLNQFVSGATEKEIEAGTPVVLPKLVDIEPRLK